MGGKEAAAYVGVCMGREGGRGRRGRGRLAKKRILGGDEGRDFMPFITVAVRPSAGWGTRISMDQAPPHTPLPTPTHACAQHSTGVHTHLVHHPVFAACNTCICIMHMHLVYHPKLFAPCVYACSRAHAPGTPPQAACGICICAA